MFGDRRRLMVAGAVAGAVVLAVWMLWPASSNPSAEAPAARPRGGARPAGAAPLEPVASVKLEALTAERQEPSGTARNPFRYQPRPVPPPPRIVAPPPAAGEGERPAPAPPAGLPPPPPIPLKFIGVLERANGVKWAVLSDGKATMHGRDGDIIDGRYRIVKIGVESIEVTYVDGRGRQVIRLTGQ